MPPKKTTAVTTEDLIIDDVTATILLAAATGKILQPAAIAKYTGLNAPAIGMRMYRFLPKLKTKFPDIARALEMDQPISKVTTSEKGEREMKEEKNNRKQERVRKRKAVKEEEEDEDEDLVYLEKGKKLKLEEHISL